MTQLGRYRSLVEQREGMELDSSYRAALYILSGEPELTDKAFPYVSREGIDFEAMLDHPYLCTHERPLVALAYNLFRWETKSPPTPHELAQLGYPYIDVIVQALYIASGLHTVREEYSVQHGSSLQIDKRRYEQAVKFRRFIENPENCPAVKESE